MSSDATTAPEASRPKSRLRAILRRIVWAVAATAAAAAIMGGVVVATTALHDRAARAEGPPPTPPLPVATLTVEIADAFDVEARFAGLIEPARETELAFERGGLVLEVLADEGDRLEAGAAVARLDDQALQARREQLRAERRRLDARMALATRTTTRRETLLGRGFASDQTADEARFAAEAVTAQIDSIEAQIHELEIELEKSALRAPFAGTVAERRIDEGAVVAAGAPLLTLQETARPMARIGAPPEIAAGLALGARHAVRVGGVDYAARVVSVAPSIDPTARTVDALLALEIEAHAKPPAMGEVARLTLSRSIDGRGFWLPLSALQEGEKGLWTVYTLAPEQSPQAGAPLYRVGQAAVEILHVEGERVFVRGALANGARVVSGGVNRIARGQLAADAH